MTLAAVSGSFGVLGAGVDQPRHDHAVHERLPAAVHALLHAQGGYAGGGAATAV